MSLETEIEGNPGQIEGIATWLRGSLATTVGDCADRLNTVRRVTGEAWHADAGEEFAASMTTGRDAADRLEQAAKDMANDFDDFAADVRRCQTQMGEARQAAREAGLTVSGYTIVDPGPGPAMPEPNFEGTPEQAQEYADDVEAYNAHLELIRAYNAAEWETGRIDRQYRAACEELMNTYALNDHAAWVLTLGDIMGDGVVAALGVSVALSQSKLAQQAQTLLDEAGQAIDEMQAHPERYLKRKWLIFQTVDRTRLDADRLVIEGKLDAAQDLIDEARSLEGGKLPKALGHAGRILGPLGVGLGIYSDYEDGETIPQIAASQGGGLAAGILAGAGAGALVGSVVPVAGTAVGAVVGTIIGAGVGLFADGAIDSLFENGPDVGEAFESGWESLVDTGDAIVDAGSGIVSGIKGWFD